MLSETGERGASTAGNGGEVGDTFGITNGSEMSVDNCKKEGIIYICVLCFGLCVAKIRKSDY